MFARTGTHKFRVTKFPQYFASKGAAAGGREMKYLRATAWPNIYVKELTGSTPNHIAVTL